MRNLKIILYIISLILTTNYTFAKKNEDIYIKSFSSPQTKKQAEIIEKKVRIFRKKVKNLQKKYDRIDDKTIQKHISDLDKILDILQKIQLQHIKTEDTHRIMNSVIQSLKKVNISTKSYFRSIKKKHKTRRNKYNKLATRLSINLIKLVSVLRSHSINNSLKYNNKITLKLLSLEKRAETLKMFKTQKFKDIKKAKKSLIKTLKRVKKDFKQLREIKK